MDKHSHSNGWLPWRYNIGVINSITNRNHANPSQRQTSHVPRTMSSRPNNTVPDPYGGGRHRLPTSNIAGREHDNQPNTFYDTFGGHGEITSRTRAGSCPGEFPVGSANNTPRSHRLGVRNRVPAWFGGPNDGDQGSVSNHQRQVIDHMVTVQFVQIELVPVGSMIILVLGRATRSGRPPSPKTRFQTGLMVN